MAANFKKLIVLTAGTICICLAICGALSLYAKSSIRNKKTEVSALCAELVTEQDRDVQIDNITFNTFDCLPQRNPYYKRFFPVILKCRDESSYKKINYAFKNIATYCNTIAFTKKSEAWSKIYKINSRDIIGLSMPLEFNGPNVSMIANFIVDISDFMKKIASVKTIGITSIFVILAAYFVVVAFFLLSQKSALQRSVVLDENIIESYDDREMFKRRRAKRLKADILLLEYKCGGILGFFRTWQRTPVDDVSNTGAGIFIKEEFKKGKTLTVKIKIPGTRSEFITKAGIVYSRKLPKKNYFRVGVKFRGKTFSNKTLGKLLITS